GAALGLAAVVLAAELVAVDVVLLAAREAVLAGPSLSGCSPGRSFEGRSISETALLAEPTSGVPPGTPTAALAAGAGCTAPSPAAIQACACAASVPRDSLSSRATALRAGSTSAATMPQAPTSAPASAWPT